MPDERTYHVISDDNCKFESMTKEQILAAIVQAVEGHSISDVDTGFVQVLKEQNHGTGLKFWVGSSAEYNALQTIEQDVFYILTDDTELEDMEADIASFREDLASFSATLTSQGEQIELMNIRVLGNFQYRLVEGSKNGFIFHEGDEPFDTDIDVKPTLNILYVYYPIPDSDEFEREIIYLRDMKIVIVETSTGDQILCNVYNRASGTYIRGVQNVGANYYHNEGESQAGGMYSNIYVDLYISGNKLQVQRTICFSQNYALVNGEYTLRTTILPITISKIIGVM